MFLTRRKLLRTSIWTHGPDEDRPRLLIETQNARFGQISPDGRWLAYVADVRARPEVYVVAYPRADGAVRVSTDGGGEPVWSRNGDELFFRGADGTMFAATFESEPRFRVTGTTALFRNAYDPEVGGHQHYDVARDGRFLMIENHIATSDRVHIAPCGRRAEADEH